jgi:hypothetical protein
MRLYRITNGLHGGRAVDIPCHEIVGVVSTWLAELGIRSQLAEDVARVDARATGPPPMPLGIAYPLM